MKYRIVLIETDEGFAVGCPALPGCWSQGASRTEAIANIQDAIREVLEVQSELQAKDFELEWENEEVNVETREIELLIHA